MTSVNNLAEHVADTYGIGLDAARDVVGVHVDTIADDPDLWNDDTRMLTLAGRAAVLAAIAESYRQDLHSTREDQMLAELEQVVADVDALSARRDVLVRALMSTAVPRARIAAAAGVREARLYQIKDGRR